MRPVEISTASDIRWVTHNVQIDVNAGRYQQGIKTFKEIREKRPKDRAKANESLESISNFNIIIRVQIQQKIHLKMKPPLFALQVKQ